MKKLIVLLVVFAGLAAGGSTLYGWLSKIDSPEVQFRTAKIRRGDVEVTISATGTIEPEEVVDIGAQVVGRISQLGKDPRGNSDSPVFDQKFADRPVDYCSPVEQGMLLAQIDPAIYAAQKEQAEASVALAEANVKQMEAKRIQAEAEWERAQRLKDLKLTSRSPTGSATTTEALPIKGISDADFILAKANFDSAAASLAAAKATVKQQEAVLALAQTNLNYTTIKSPVDGTIIDRRVNIGQTVVSSMNAPSLFLIARDLRRMQVWALVNEADIGRLKIGTHVHFRVEAFPQDLFKGTVEQIRLNASITQNVVIYTVVISVDNSDLKLLPYLTADVKFEIESRSDAVVVPNAALRYQPKSDQIAEEEPEDVDESSASSARHADNETASEARRGTVWTVEPDSGLLSPIELELGITDGAVTEVLNDEVLADTEVVIGESRAAVSTEVVNNPFVMPPRGGRGGNPGGGQSRGAK